MTFNIWLACLTLLCAGNAAAQDLTSQAKKIMARPDVARAFADVEANRARILGEWRALTEINAPSGKEHERAEAVQQLLSTCKLDTVYFDSKGNLIAIRKGTGGAKAVVFDAHLDTVFQEGLKIKTEIRDGKLFAPGVGDNTRNVEALLASIRALDKTGLKTKADLIFVFSVEEESSMVGARQFVSDNRDRIGQYVALDTGNDRVTYGGIGINWYRHHFIGPGGHTRSATPPYSASLPLARAITRIYSLELPGDPEVNVNIGMIGGSYVVNAKASDAWFTVDLRSTDQAVLQAFELKIAAIVAEEADRAGMQSRTELVVEKLPAAQVPGMRGSFTVRMSEAVHRAVGFDNIRLTNTASNNANIALLTGIPAISTGTAPCDNEHALTEWCWIEPFYGGIKKLILLEVALAGVNDGSQ